MASLSKLSLGKRRFPFLKGNLSMSIVLLCEERLRSVVMPFCLLMSAGFTHVFSGAIDLCSFNMF